MVEKLYLRQGGERIEVEEKPDLITMEVSSIEKAFSVADEAGVEVTNVMPIADNMMRMQTRGERDAAMESIRGAGEVLHHVYNAVGNPDDEIVITESLYLRFSPDVTDARKGEIVEKENLEVLDRIDDQNWLVKVTEATGKNPIRSANALEREDEVEFAEPNLVHMIQRFDAPITDDLFPRQWHLSSPADGIDLVKGAGIDVLAAWEKTFGIRDIVVGVLDDGFDLTHPDLKGPDKVAAKINFKPSGNGDFTIDDLVMPRPGDFHGSPCAGVAIAERNCEGTLGVAPGCAFVPVRFPLSIQDAQLAKLFELVSDLVDVVSCSWGFGPTYRPMSTRLRDVITKLAKSGGRRKNGLVFCVAAGNHNCPIKDLKNTVGYQYPGSFGFLETHLGPIDRWIAAHPDVITVSASTSLKTRAVYSSWGKELSVCAPSSNFDDLKHFQPRGLGIVTIDNEGFGAKSDFSPGSRYTSNFGGTSSATPTVAGVCALVLSVNPELSGPQVKEIIEETADKDLVISSESQVNVSGEFVDGFSQWFGHGKVNAGKAVKAALATTAVS